jgi:hypothetical protein
MAGTAEEQQHGDSTASARTSFSEQSRSRLVPTTTVTRRACNARRFSWTPGFRAGCKRFARPLLASQRTPLSRWTRRAGIAVLAMVMTVVVFAVVQLAAREYLLHML